jgi:hypothetical protein
MHLICMQVKPNERAYSMTKRKQSVLDKRSKQDAAVEPAVEGEEENAEDANEPTKKAAMRKESTVERLMKIAGHTKGGSFRREQLKLDLVLNVLKRFGRVHVDMVSVI